MATTIFLDNDIVSKLAEYDMLEECCGILGVPATDVYVLDSLIYMLRKLQERSSPQHTDDGLARAIAFTDKARKLTEETPIELMRTVLDVKGADIGEVQLAHAAIEHEGQVVLVTGDKRFLRVLATAAELRQIYNDLTGQVACLEIVVCALVNTISFDEMRLAITKCPRCDKTMQIVWGSQQQIPDDQVVNNLKVYLKRIESEVGAEWLLCLMRLGTDAPKPPCENCDMLRA